MSFSGRAYFFFSTIIALGIVGQWWGGILYGLWRFPAAALILAIAFEAYRLPTQTFSIRRRIDTRLSLGQAIAGDTIIHNNGTRFLHLENQVQYTAELVGEEALVRWELEPGTTISKRFTVIPVRLGRTSLGHVYVRVLGYLGLVWWSKKMDDIQPVEIVPHTLTNAERDVGSERTGNKRRRRALGAGDDLLSLRDYQPGDPLHAIDWKATARSQRPTVRVYGQEHHMELVLLLDVGRNSQLQSGSLTRLHHYVNVAARLSELAIGDGDRVGLVAFADRPLRSIPVSKGNRCLQSIRNELQVLRSQPRESNPLAAVLFLRRMLQHRSLVVLLTEIEDPESGTQLVKATSLLVPKHSPLIASLVDERIDTLRYQAANHWLDPFRRYAALEYTRSARRTALHLRRLGAGVVAEKPDRLDPAVLGYYRRLRERKRV